LLVPFTDDIDLGGRGKRIYNIFGSSGATANTIRLRKTNLAGAVQLEIQVPINSSKEITMACPAYQAEGWFVEVAPGTTFQGSVEIG
jgi:hypothetical protein